MHLATYISYEFFFITKSCVLKYFFVDVIVISEYDNDINILKYKRV